MAKTISKREFDTLKTRMSSGAHEFGIQCPDGDACFFARHGCPYAHFEGLCAEYLRGTGCHVTNCSYEHPYKLPGINLFLIYDHYVIVLGVPPDASFNIISVD